MDKQSQKMIFNACGVISAVALVLGGFAAVANGFELPPWLLSAELAILSLASAACCFTAVVPRLMPWLLLPPIQGTLLIVGGVLAVYVPPQFVLAAVLLGLGSRKVWAVACSLAGSGTPKVTPAGTTLAGAETLPARQGPPAAVIVRSEIIPPPRVTRIGSIELVLDGDR